MKKLFLIREGGNEVLVATFAIEPSDYLIEKTIDEYANYYLANIYSWKLKEGKNVLKSKNYEIL